VHDQRVIRGQGRLYRVKGYGLKQVGQCDVLTWHKTGFEIGKTLADLRMIEPVELCEPPFKLWMSPIGARMCRCHDSDRGCNCRGLWMIMRLDVVMVDATRMKMSPVTPTEYMILELDRYIALSGCKYVPQLLGLSGDPQDRRVQGYID
jgi:hypothetical protein